MYFSVKVPSSNPVTCKSVRIIQHTPTMLSAYHVASLVICLMFIWDSSTFNRCSIHTFSVPSFRSRILKFIPIIFVTADTHNCISAESKERPLSRFGQVVANHLLCRTIRHHDKTIIDSFCNIEISNVNTPGSFSTCSSSSFCHFDCTGVVLLYQVLAT